MSTQTPEQLAAIEQWFIQLDCPKKEQSKLRAKFKELGWSAQQVEADMVKRLEKAKSASTLKTVVFEFDGETVTKTDLFLVFSSMRDGVLCEWARTYRTGFADKTVTDLRLYRKGQLESAAGYDRKYRAVMNSLDGVVPKPPGDMGHQGLAYLKAMMRRDKWSLAHTSGVRIEFPKDAVAQATADLVELGWAKGA